MKFVQLQPKTYESFVQSHTLGNFLQSTAIGRRRQVSGWRAHLVGVKDSQGRVVAAALLSSRRVLGRYSDFECLQGPILDYDDQTLVDFFFRELKVYLRAENALQLRFNPPLLRHHRNADADIIDDGYQGQRYVQLLEAQGARHLDDRRVDRDPLLLRWYFAKDMSDVRSEAQLLESFDQQTRWSVRKTQKTGIEVVVCDPANLDVFYDIMQHTGRRRHFDARDKQYYQDLARLFGPDRILFCLAQLPLDTYRANLRRLQSEEQKALKEIKHQQRTQPDDKKLETQRRVRQEAIDNYQAKLTDSFQLGGAGETLVLASAVFIRYGHELVYFASGSYDQHASFNAPYALQWYALTYAIKHRIRRYNFYGTKGDFSGHSEQQGVYKFKKGFGGVIEEQIGYFELSVHPVLGMARRGLALVRSVGRRF